MKFNSISLLLGFLASTACGTTSLQVSLTDAPVDDAEKVEVTISEVSIHFVPKGAENKNSAGSLNRAIQYYKKALQIKSKSISVMFQLAGAYEKQGPSGFDAAINLYKKVMSIDSESDEAMMAYSRLRLAKTCTTTLWGQELTWIIPSVNSRT